jgi:Flp pilus assembly CpaF family ATPase
MTLPDGTRLKAIWGGHGQNGLAPHPVACLRRQGGKRRFTLEELLDRGLGSKMVGSALAAIVRARRTLLISGTTFAGKTTLSRALGLAAGGGSGLDRIIQLESTGELGLGEGNLDVVELQARAANVEGRGEVTLADLVEDTLQMKPDRIWLGEIKGPADAAALLNALSNGHRGSVATMHANSAEDAPSRLIALCGQPPAEWSSHVAARVIKTSIDFIVHLELDRASGQPDRRYVSTILEVEGVDGDQVQCNTIFAPGDDGRAEPADAMSTANARALAATGYHHRAAPSEVQR